MEVWITCPDCGEKVLSNRMKAAELLRVHEAVCPLRVEVPASSSSPPKAAATRSRQASETPALGAEGEEAEVGVAPP